MSIEDLEAEIIEEFSIFLRKLVPKSIISLTQYSAVTESRLCKNNTMGKNNF